MGLFILLSILNPIIGLIERQITAEQLPAMASGADSPLTNTHVLSTANNVAEKRDQLTHDLYARDLCKQIRATVMSIDGVANAKVIVTLEPATPENKRVGNIKNVSIYIEPGVTNNEHTISKVTVDVSLPKATEESKPLPATVIDKTLRTITELYQLKPSQVEVMRMN